jgi:putative ABC transport system substrate-binding protein
MRRREFITALGGAVAGWPLAARGEQRDLVRRLGVLMAFAENDVEVQARVAAFRQELRKSGWSEGANLRIDERWAGDDMDRVRAFAAELVKLKPDAILVGGRRAVSVLQQQTRSIPVVFAGISEPVETGVVTSLARPGGNLTGFAVFELPTFGKGVELLKQTAPHVARMALMFNPANPATAFYPRPFETAATALGIQPVILRIQQPADIERAIDEFAREPNGGIFFSPDVTLVIHRELTIAKVTQHRLPSMCFDRILVISGGLMSYGPDRLDIYRRSASYVDRIFRGESPADLPVQHPTKFELVINLKTARALGLTVPPTLIVRAEVIE